MTHEERFTKIENALAHTAELQAQMQERQAEHDEDVKELRRMNKSLMLAVGEIAKQHMVGQRTLVEGQRTLTEAQRLTDEKVNILLQAQIETEHKLQRWIDGNSPAAS